MTKFLIQATGALLLLAVVFGACKNSDERDPCFEPKSVYLQMGAYRMADTGTLVLDTLLPHAILGPVDSPQVFNYTPNVSKFILFLSPLRDSCSYFFRADSEATTSDTLNFQYTRRLQFLSNACGYTYFFSLEQVRSTNHAIDSVRISNYDVTNNASIEHLRVYFHK